MNFLKSNQIFAQLWQETLASNNKNSSFKNKAYTQAQIGNKTVIK